MFKCIIKWSVSNKKKKKWSVKINKVVFGDIKGVFGLCFQTIIFSF